MGTRRDSRSVRRNHYDDHTRMTLLEDDLDVLEAAQAEVSAKLDRVIRWLVTGAISFSFTAILLGVNIAYNFHR
jgi:hypothetical protein